jgi:hypothetical protein
MDNKANATNPRRRKSPAARTGAAGKHAAPMDSAKKPREEETCIRRPAGLRQWRYLQQCSWLLRKSLRLKREWQH